MYQDLVLPQHLLWMITEVFCEFSVNICACVCCKVTIIQKDLDTVYGNSKESTLCLFNNFKVKVKTFILLLSNKAYRVFLLLSLEICINIDVLVSNVKWSYEEGGTVLSFWQSCLQRRPQSMYAQTVSFKAISVKAVAILRCFLDMEWPYCTHHWLQSCIPPKKSYYCTMIRMYITVTNFHNKSLENKS